MPHSKKPVDCLIDTSIFIRWFKGDEKARNFFRFPPGRIYYSKITRKELLRPPISDSEKRAIMKFLGRFRQINPDPIIAKNFSELLSNYAYLKDHLPDALIAATALTKGLILVTTNKRHFLPIQNLTVRDLITFSKH